MQQKARLFLGVVFVILIGGVLAVKVLSSEHLSTQEMSLPSSFTHSPFKMSGVVKKIEVDQLILANESGLEKTVTLTKETTLSLEGKPIQRSELKPGDVIDIDCEVDEDTKQPFAKDISVIISSGAEQTSQEGEGSKDSEFE